MSLTWPNQHLTLQEWAAMPAVEEARVELVEGLVAMTPMPPFRHQRFSARLSVRLDEQLPPELTSLAAVEVVVSDPPPTVRVPDIVVTYDEIAELNPPRVGSADVLLAVEVLSDRTAGWTGC